MQDLEVMLALLAIYTRLTEKQIHIYEQVAYQIITILTVLPFPRYLEIHSDEHSD